MHFFRTREVADAWVERREAVVALSLEDAFELAQTHWVRRLAEAEVGASAVQDLDR